VRLDGAQDRQRARGEGVVAELDEGVAQPLGAGAQIAGRPVGLDERFQRGLQFSPPTGSSSARIDRLPSECFARVSDRLSVGSGSVPSGSSRAR
jgi:hypothetical protein